MSPRKILIHNEIAEELNLPYNHEIAKRGYYLGYGRGAIYSMIRGNGPVSVSELYELADAMGYDDKEIDLAYFRSPDSARTNEQ